MIVFKNIKYKNILSAGNVFTEIELDKCNNTLVIGENGAGKSTFLDALCFVLFGKPFRKINKPKLVNSITRRDMIVEVNFTTNGIEYTIVRGMKPNVFSIYKNGVLINQAADNRDYQGMLEKQILHMNYNTFCKVVILGSASFSPFMQLPAAARREVVESLLDLQVFTNMNVLLKTKVTENDNVIRDLQFQLEMKNNEIRLTKEHLSAVELDAEKQIADKNERIFHAKTEIDTKLININDLLEEVSKLNSGMCDENKVTNKLRELEKMRHKFNERIAKHEKDVDFFKENEICPTCRQIIKEDFRCETIEIKQSRIDEFREALTKTVSEYNKLNDKLTEINKVQAKINKLNLDVQINQSRVQMLNKYITELEEDIVNIRNTSEARVDAAALSALENDFEKIKTQLQKANTDRRLIAIMGSMLKDSGIKSKIIVRYVPIMNKLINKYLSAMDFFIDFNLNENFEETIGSRFRDDFSYESFSEGEKLRIDLAILFAWRAVSKMRNSVNTNLLIMDEIMDSSLDDAGVDEFLKILTVVAESDNVFIISHKTDNIIDRFDRVLRFHKVKNFSKLVE